MIEDTLLKQLLKEYNIDYENLKRKSYIMKYQDIEEVEKILYYLVKIKRINIKNIEKCPSILSMNFKTLKENYEFLEQENNIILKVQTCLHTLGTNPTNLKETYFYVKEKYGKILLNKNPSILKVPLNHIKKIEKIFIKHSISNKELVLSACVSCKNSAKAEEILSLCKLYEIVPEELYFKNSVESAKLKFELCKKYNVKMEASIFQKKPEELEKLLKFCSEKNFEPKGNVYYRTDDELKEIIDICDKYNIPKKGTVFQRPPKELLEIIKVCEKYDLEPSGVIFQKTKEELEKIIEIANKNKIDIKTNKTILYRPSIELEEIIRICRENDIDTTGIVFSIPLEQFKKVLEICKENNIDIKINKSVFYNNAIRLEEIIKICKKYQIPIEPMAFQSNPEELEKLIKLYRKYNIIPKSTLFVMKSNELEEKLKIAEENNIKPNGYYVLKSLSGIKEILKICEKYEIDPSTTKNVFLNNAKELEEVIKLCIENNIDYNKNKTALKCKKEKIEGIISLKQEYDIALEGAIFLRSKEEILETIKYLEENYGRKFITRSILSISLEHLKEILPILEEFNILDTVKQSASILLLSKKELIAKINFLIEEEKPLVVGKHYNTFFGMNEKRMKENFNITKEELYEKYLEKDKRKKR